MYETSEDLVALQALLDVSYNRSGEHLRTIWGPETRLPAQQVSLELAGVQLLDLATVTQKGEPRVAPVDCLFYRGHFWFGSAKTTVRFSNIHANTVLRDCMTHGPEYLQLVLHYS